VALTSTLKSSKDSDLEARISKGKRSKNTRPSIHINELPLEILVHAFTFLRSKDVALFASLVSNHISS
jgi:hypothetical protein